LRAKLIDRVVVSTEDEEIAEISESFGAEVPFLRPKEMAEDRSSIGDGVKFTVDKLRDSNYFPKFVVTLYPTHPFRTPKLVDFLVSKGLEGYRPVRTVKLITHTNLSIFSKNGAECIAPLLNFRSYNGAVSKKSFFRQYGLFLGSIFGFFARPYLHVIKDPINLIDIDSLVDFVLAEEIIKQGLFDFGLE
ncbi:MAG: cytidylyltransferase domain-containing protein, partial [Candidatus Helarchaeota archaeon]